MKPRVMPVLPESMIKAIDAAYQREQPRRAFLAECIRILLQNERGKMLLTDSDIAEHIGKHKRIGITPTEIRLIREEYSIPSTAERKSIYDATGELSKRERAQRDEIKRVKSRINKRNRKVRR